MVADMEIEIKTYYSPRVSEVVVCTERKE